jgi:hypothetical protein
MLMGTEETYIITNLTILNSFSEMFKTITIKILH